MRDLYDTPARRAVAEGRARALAALEADEKAERERSAAAITAEQERQAELERTAALVAASVLQPATAGLAIDALNLANTVYNPGDGKQRRSRSAELRALSARRAEAFAAKQAGKTP